MESLIARLKDRLRHAPAIESLAGCVITNEAGEILPPVPPNRPISAGDLAEAERRLGFPLPSLVRRLALEVADGGYGPAWGINRLKHPPNAPFGPSWQVEMSVESWHEFYRKEPPPELATLRPAKFIRFCEVGCNIWIGVDCTTDAALLFQDDPNRGGASPRSVAPLDITLEEWLARWLDDTPWPSALYP